MEKHWESYFQARARESRAKGPYHAIGIVQGICENTGLSATEKIDHINYFLSLLMEGQEGGGMRA